MIWDAAILILDDHIAVVAILSDAKLAGIVILQGYTEPPRNFLQIFHAEKLMPYGKNFRSGLDRRITNSPRLCSIRKGYTRQQAI